METFCKPYRSHRRMRPTVRSVWSNSNQRLGSNQHLPFFGVFTILFASPARNGRLRRAEIPIASGTTGLRSRDNERVRHWTKLAQDTRYRRKTGHALIEGPHLVAALLDKGMKAASLLVAENSLADPEISALVKRGGT